MITGLHSFFLVSVSGGSVSPYGAINIIGSSFAVSNVMIIAILVKYKTKNSQLLVMVCLPLAIVDACMYTLNRNIYTL